MIRSMTGFGAAERQTAQWTVRAEVRSVNHKDLRLTLRVPDTFRMKELELQKLVASQVRRGHVYLSLACRPAADRADVLVDDELCKEYVAALRRLAASEGLPFQADLAALLRLPGVLRDITTDEDLREDLWPEVVAAAKGALDALVEMRQAEGANLADHLRELCGAIAALVDGVEAEQGGLVAAYQQRLKERVERLLAGTDVPVDDEVLAREVALYADRSDVSEEVARLRSHLQQFREALDADEAVGRKMEFLGQEMLREANTLSAKLPAGPQVRQALELKTEVERLREQVRNVE